MSDTPEGTTAPPEGTGTPPPPPPPPPPEKEPAETHTDAPTREEFTTLGNIVQTLADTVAKLVPDSRDSSPVKPPWHARGWK